MHREHFQKATFRNGLRVIVAPMPHMRSVSVSLFVGAGSRYEPAEMNGLSHFVEHMCFKGTSKYPTPLAIAEVIDSVGGALNAVTDRELTVFYCKTAPHHMAIALDVLTDMLRAPLFVEDEVEKERHVIIEELSAALDSPSQQVDVLLDETMWPDQPLGREVAGTKETVATFTRETGLAYLDRQYRPGNAVVSIAGATTWEEVEPLLRRFLGDWQPGASETWYPAVNCQTAARLAVRRKPVEQAHISAGFRGVPSQHPDRFTLGLLSVILGEGMSSRLFLEVRERRALCYDIHSYASHFSDAGLFAVYAAVDPGKATDAVQAILAELARVRLDISAEEIARAKDLVKARLLLRMEDTRNVSGWFGSQEMLTHAIYTTDQIMSMIDSVSAADATRVAESMLRTEHLNLAVVGPFRTDKRFAPLLKI